MRERNLDEGDGLSAQARAVEIARRLEEDIALGLLMPRERLLEEDLVEKFAAKRHIVRQSLVELESFGVITREPNRGAAVRDFTPKEVEDIYLVRELVERCAAELIPLPASPQLLATLTRIQAVHSAAVRRRDLRVVFRQNLLFHRAFFAACAVPPLVQVVEQFAMKAHAIRSYTIGDADLLAQVCREHEHLIELLRRGDRSDLVKLVTQHIQPAKKAYLAAVARFAPLAAGTRRRVRVASKV